MKGPVELVVMFDLKSYAEASIPKTRTVKKADVGKLTLSLNKIRPKITSPIKPIKNGLLPVADSKPTPTMYGKYSSGFIHYHHRVKNLLI